MNDVNKPFRRGEQRDKRRLPGAGRGQRAEDGGQRTEGGDGSAPACLRATHRQVPGAPDGVPAVGVPWATSRPGVIRRFGSSPRGRGERRARPVCHRQAAQADARAPHSQTPEDGRQRSGSHLERVSGEPPETAGEPPALPIPRLQRTEDRGRAATWDGVSGEPPETAGEPPALPRLPLRAFAVQLRRRRQSCRATNPASARPPKATVPGSGTTSISSPQFTSWL